MKRLCFLLAAAIGAGLVSLPVSAQTEPTHVRFGAQKSLDEFINIEIRNYQDESLGRISDLAIDLVNGRIVEVLVTSGRILGFGGKTVAVPPLALAPDLLNQVYRLNVSAAVFKTAPAIDVAQWQDSNRGERIAAAYHLFGQETYFLEAGATASPAAPRPKMALGYVERSSKILNLPVGNHQQEKLGKVWSMSFDITRGRILSVVILAPGNFKTKSIVPPTALRFNARRDALLLDDSKQAYADEPRYVVTEAANGQGASSQEESYAGPRTTETLEQGRSYRDVDQTVRINRKIRAAKISAHDVEVGTMNGRVTLRGKVRSAEDRRRIGEIAIADSRLELVDNQIVVEEPRR